MSKKKDLITLSEKELEQIITDEGYPKFHASQIYEWIFKKDASDFSVMSSLPKDLRKTLDKKYYVHNCEIEKTEEDEGGAVKFLIRLFDNKKIEAAALRKDDRVSLCISTQAGCAMGCAYCATANMGFQRNLSAQEIIAQFILMRAYTKKVNSVVFMGMGEPFQNLKNLMKSLDVINGYKSLNMGARHITISTAGDVEGIKRLSTIKRPFRLAVSLNSLKDKLRSELMPINKKYPLKKLLPALADYWNQTKRKITLEWVMIDGVNDALSEAHKLLELKNDFGFKVNIIPYNPTDVKKDFAAAKSDRIRAFKRILKEGGIESIERFRQGRGVNAACGQLCVKE